jgi:hypothetical protein
MPKRAKTTLNHITQLLLPFLTGCILTWLLTSAIHLNLHVTDDAPHATTTITPTSQPSQIPKCQQLPNQCKFFRYDAEDPITFSTSKPEIFTPHNSPVQGQFIKGLTYQSSNSSFVVTKHCDQQLGGNVGGFYINFGALPYQVIENKPVESKHQQQCRVLPGLWILLSNRRDESKDNLFDQLSTDLYHVHLMKKALCGSSRVPIKITHINSIKTRSTVAFKDAVDYLGEYIPWSDIIDEEQGGGCVRFEYAATTAAAWLWIDSVLPTYSNTALTEFVSGFTHHLAVADIKPDPCRPKIILSRRKEALEDPNFPTKAGRAILNMDAMVEATQKALPGWQVEDVFFAKMSMADQVALVKSASIFVFPHGGAGPHVLWLTPGAVVIELFPHKSSDPVYRNMATQTGKSYMGLQATEFVDAELAEKAEKSYHFRSASNFYVDLERYVKLLRSGEMIVRGSVGDSWMPALKEMHSFDTAMCPWSSVSHDECARRNGVAFWEAFDSTH